MMPIQPSDIRKARDLKTGEIYEVTNCHICMGLIDMRQGHYQDNMGRWEFCSRCYVHAVHPGGYTIARHYAVERTKEIKREYE